MVIRESQSIQAFVLKEPMVVATKTEGTRYAIAVVRGSAAEVIVKNRITPVKACVETTLGIGPCPLSAVDFKAVDWCGNCIGHLSVGRITGGERFTCLRT
ncbi:hypothetical protein TNCV_361051 [Trichonephila clavipes]|nr:hypothetical protein TNCV_361051 [Trichonephila clavipes]